MNRFPGPGTARLRRLLLTLFEILFRQVCLMVLASPYKIHEGLKRSASPMLLFFSGFVLTANECEKLKRQKPF